MGYSGTDEECGFQACPWRPEPVQWAEWLPCDGPDDGTSVDTIPAGRHDAVDFRHGVPQHNPDFWTFNFFGAFKIARRGPAASSGPTSHSRSPIVTRMFASSPRMARSL